MKSFKKSWLLSKTDEHKWTIVHIFHSLTPPPHKHSCVQNCAHTAQAPTRSILSWHSWLLWVNFSCVSILIYQYQNTGQIPVIVNVAFASRQSLNCTASFFSQITTQIRLKHYSLVPSHIFQPISILLLCLFFISLTCK